ncbi:hypothetical protein [Cryptosporangium sp. NPDC048952]|uniref:hypothetical protein n=1 Tax=Cryptosporangium sp. NPDC048952 TaxID=3363961 RepID=UPI0037154768
MFAPSTTATPRWRLGVDALACWRPTDARLPLLWQTYLNVWGGFLISEYIDEELAAIGAEVGLTADEVDDGTA